MLFLLVWMPLAVIGFAVLAGVEWLGDHLEWMSVRIMLAFGMPALTVGITRAIGGRLPEDQLPALVVIVSAALYVLLSIVAITTREDGE